MAAAKAECMAFKAQGLFLKRQGGATLKYDNTAKVLIERSCHTKFYERSLQTPSSEQYCQSAEFHYSAFTHDVT